jgi:hypothetical protein
MSLKYSKWSYNASTFSNLMPSAIYPNWDFWFETEPSGNPASSNQFQETSFQSIRRKESFCEKAVFG